jgi:MFS family permease
VAGAVGPFLGGWLVGIEWRLVFLLNLPLAAVIVGVAVRHVPESRDPEAAHHLDWPGTALVVAGLGALTYGLTAAGEPDSGPGVWAWVAAGLVALAAFVAVQRRSPAPLVPPGLFASRQFTAANAVTLLVYAPLGVVFVLLVIQLQVVAGYDPLPAGTALLPVTALMLVFSARVGALAQRVGPRPLLTAGPLVAAAGVLLVARIGPDAGYLTDVLPATAVFGAGLTLLVAPLTATVLDSAPDRLAGVASGVNNAVARAAGLLAVAIVPAVAGLGGTGVGDPAGFATGFRTAMLVCAGLLVCGALVAAVLVRRTLGTPPSEPRQRLRVEECPHCGVTGPQVHPAMSGEGMR